MATSDEGTPLQPEHVFKKVIWRSTLAAGGGLEQFTTWTLTGIGAIVGLLISNLDSVSKIVSLAGIESALVLFTLSLLAAVISKQFGMAIANGLETINKVEGLLHSPEGQHLMGAMTIPPKQLVRELAEPFVWPMSTIIRRSGERGVTDYLSPDKRLVRFFCAQVYLNILHGLLALSALLVIGLSIQ